jgi:hypothetical protein
MQVQEAVRARDRRRSDGGQVHAAGRTSRVHEVDEPRGDELADRLLCFRGAAADVRREDDVRQPAQRAVEGIAIGQRFLREHVDRGAAHVAGTDAGRQRREVDHLPACEVEEDGARAHLPELALADQAAVRGPAVDMQAHHVGLAEELSQRAALARVAERKPLLQVVVDDLHPHRLRQDRELRSDVAVAHDAEHLPAHLGAAGGGLSPASVVQQAVGIGDASHQHHDLADRHLDDAARVAVRRVEHRDAARGRSGEVHLVGPDAEAPDREQPVGGRQHAWRHAGLRPDAEDAHALDRALEFVLAERVGERLDAVALVAQRAGRVGVYVLAEERGHAALGERGRSRKPVEPQHLVHGTGHTVGAGHHRLALDVLAVGHELVRGAIVADLGVGDAVADRHHAPRKPQRPDRARLAAGLGQQARSVEPRDTLALPRERIAVDALGRDAEVAAHGLHVLAESAGDDMDAARVPLHGRGVPAEGRAQPLPQEAHHRVDVLALDREHRQPPAQALINADRARHAVARDGLDGLDGALAIGVVGQRDARELIESLHRHDGAVEVEDELDGVEVLRRARHVRGSWGRRWRRARRHQAPRGAASAVQRAAR